jgi:hypothetical protein
VPAVPSSIIEPIWDQFAALLPAREVPHPLGYHRRRIPDRLVFAKLVQVLVFGCASARMADATGSATPLRRRRDAWIAAGGIAALPVLVPAADDRMIGLTVDDVAIDGCITTAPCGGEGAGRSPVDRGKQGRKRSVAVAAAGIPLATIAAPANRHDSPLLGPPLAALKIGDRPMTVHRDRGDDARATRKPLATRGLTAAIAAKGKPAPVTAGQRWVVERTNAWSNAYQKLVGCTERRTSVIAFWITFSTVIIIVGRLMRQTWTRYRWQTRPCRRP